MSMDFKKIENELISEMIEKKILKFEDRYFLNKKILYTKLKDFSEKRIKDKNILNNFNKFLEKNYNFKEIEW